MFGNGEAGTGGASLGTARVGMVRQSCLGTFRRGAVTFGEAQRGSHGMARRGELSSVGAGHGKAVELWLVWERFVAVRQVMDWRGSQGFAGHVTVVRCEVGQG
jgi:hypothetical protein